MLLLFLCLLVSLVIYPNFVYILASIFLLPQIKHCFNNNQKYKWNFWIIFGLGFPKLIFAVYTKLDPINVLRITPDPDIALGFIGIVISQLFLLLIQTKMPRFGFEPKSPYKVYASSLSAKSSQELCAICLERLKGSIASSIISVAKNFNKTHQMILTPCKHEFHLTCLTEWLNSKLECPYCRTEVPALPEEDN